MSGERPDRMTIWQRAARGHVVISSKPTPAPFALTSAGGVVVPSRTSLFLISEPLDAAEPIVVTLVPPVSQAGSAPGFNGTQIQPHLGLYAIVKWGSQAQPALLEVDFAQGVAFPIWSSYVEVSVVNEQPYPTSTLSWVATHTFSAGTQIQAGSHVWIATASLTTGAHIPAAFSLVNPPTSVPDGTGLWTRVVAPEVQAFLSPGVYSYGIPRRTKRPTFSGAAVSFANPLPQIFSALPSPLVYSDPVMIPPFTQNMQVLTFPLFGVTPAFPGPPYPPVAYAVVFLDVYENIVGGLMVNPTEQTMLTVPSDAASVRIANFSSALPPTNLTSLRVVFNMDL